MSKTCRPYDPDQQLLLPAALQEWLPTDHLAYFISGIVDQMDLSEITARYEEQRGGPPYHPRMMVKVLLYGYCAGVASSRCIARRLHEYIAFRVLAANNTPDFRTVSDFRKDHLEALGNLFGQELAALPQERHLPCRCSGNDTLASLFQQPDAAENRDSDALLLLGQPSTHNVELIAIIQIAEINTRCRLVWLTATGR